MYNHLTGNSNCDVTAHNIHTQYQQLRPTLPNYHPTHGGGNVGAVSCFPIDLSLWLRWSVNLRCILANTPTETISKDDISMPFVLLENR